ncbi:MAG: ankyrin repeat domain-containing protein [Candidatus Omnitrophica bacterium]|nr:ankyrin repeat domain-containing protein [Candidatus Omnitrophota bacterium]
MKRLLFCLMAFLLLTVYVPNSCYAFGDLIEAVKNNDVASVKEALDAGIGANTTVEDSWNERVPITTECSLLMLAAKANATSVMELLINKGANINQEVKGYSALDYAIKGKSLEAVTLLLDRGAILNRGTAPIDQYGTLPNDPMYMAVRSNDPAIVRLLLERGASVNRPRSGLLWQIAMCDSKRGCSTSKAIEIAEMLLDYGVDVNGDGGDFTPLMGAATTNNYEIAEFLLGKGADPSVQDSHGSTALDGTISYGDKKMISIFRRHGVKSSFGNYASIKLRSFFNPFSILILLTISFIIFAISALVFSSANFKINSVGLVMMLLGGFFLIVTMQRILTGRFETFYTLQPYLGAAYTFLGFGIFSRRNMVRKVSIGISAALIAFLIFVGIMIFRTDYSGFGGSLQVIFIFIPLIALNVFMALVLSLKKVRAEFEKANEAKG